MKLRPLSFRDDPRSHTEIAQELREQIPPELMQFAEQVGWLSPANHDEPDQLNLERFISNSPSHVFDISMGRFNQRRFGFCSVEDAYVKLKSLEVVWNNRVSVTMSNKCDVNGDPIIVLATAES